MKPKNDQLPRTSQRKLYLAALLEIQRSVGPEGAVHAWNGNAQRLWAELPRFDYEKLLGFVGRVVEARSLKEFQARAHQ